MTMKDWADILSKFSPVALLSGLGGYFVHVFQTMSRKRRMRRQLYREISNNFQNTVVRVALVTSVEGLRQGTAFRFTEKLDLGYSVWNFYNDEKRREMLFELPEAAAICNIYAKFIDIGNDLPGYAHVRGKEAAAEVEDRLLDGTLDKKLYSKVSSPEAWRFVDDLFSGKRERYREYLNPL